MIFSNKLLNNSPPLLFNNNIIDRTNTHRHLGVYLTPNLDWSTQINDICIKANRKLSVLRSVKFLKRNTLDILYKITVRSIIDYSLPIYSNNLKMTDIARLDRLQYKAGKLVSGALHYTNRQKLNEELGWENFQTRIKFLGLTLFQKIHLHQTRPLVRKCMTKIDYERKYLTRSKVGYAPYPNFGAKYENSFFPFMTKLWNELDVNLQILPLSDFKEKLKLNLKPKKYRHFSKGSKIGNSLLSRLRLNQSDLNLHKFTVGRSESSECDCHAKSESSFHYLTECFLFSGERQILYSLVEHYIPHFLNISKTKQFEILVMGINIDQPEFNSTNTTIAIAVQKFILSTKRFS